MSILSKIQALITAANTKTGESDTTLTDAVQTLVDGYGQGGGGGSLPTGMTHIGSGSFTFASRTVLNTAINHGLSFTPRAVIIWADTEPSVAEMFYCFLTRQLANNTGTTKTERYLAVKASSTVGLDITQYASTDADLFITSTTFNVGHGSRHYAAGTTYYWFAFD